MAKIAVELEHALARRLENGSPGRAVSRVLAQGKNWQVSDVLCTSGPQDRPFEEQHADFSIAFVIAGTFQYRASMEQVSARPELMSPGSLLLGNPQQCFECGHEHGMGDRCISFWYATEHFERLAADAGVLKTSRKFHVSRMPALREMSPVIARACAGLSGAVAVSWEELSMKVAAETIRLANGLSADNFEFPPSALARITRVIRRIEHHPDSPLSLNELAEEAALSPYHFLRTFEAVTGVTPHQYILRHRLREAALRLADEPAKVLDIALDSGFGDVSNFNRAFRAEFGLSPRAYRYELRVP